MQLHSCFERFVVRNHVNWQIKISYEGSWIWRWKSMVHRRSLKTIQSEEIQFKFLRVSRQKNDRKREKSARFCTSWTASCAISAWPCAIRAWGSVATSLGSISAPTCTSSTWLRVSFTCSLFSKPDQCKKPIFLLLNPTQSFAINRDPCTHCFSFRTFTVQGVTTCF